MLQAIGSLILGVMKDVDGNYSSKRAAFFIFIWLFSIFSMSNVYLHVPVSQYMFDTLVDLIKWIGMFILAERTPAILEAAKGIDKK